MYRWHLPRLKATDLGSRLCLVVPRTLREEVLRLYHSIPVGGHFSHRKTLDRLKTRFFWPSVAQDCQIFVQSCEACSRNKKPSVRPRAALGSFHAGCVMERVHMDILGPFVQSKRGNVYILVVIDQFSKWIECFPLSNQTAESVASVFVDEFVARFGCPLQVHTDQGTNFTSDLFHSVCALLQVSKTRTTPYHPSSNGQVERMNHSVLQVVSSFLQKEQSDWDIP